jgi:hypothetical protein
VGVEVESIIRTPSTTLAREPSSEPQIIDHALGSPDSIRMIARGSVRQT